MSVPAERDLEKAALRGEPSYVWRKGQMRRLEMIAAAAGERLQGCVLENGCGVGGYASAWWFLLTRLLGYDNVKFYDGSAEEWTREPANPLVNRPPPAEANV